MSTWGSSWLESWGASWDRAYVPQNRSGGAVIVDLPKRKKKKAKALKAIEKAIEAIKSTEVETPREITEEEAKGMAAVYGAMGGYDSVAQPEPVEEIEEIAEIEAVSEPIISDDISRMLFAAQEVQAESASILPPEEDEEDEIALILAIIEAIG